MKKNILIAYFSHSGNTRKIAEQIQENVGGDLFEIQTVNPYPTEYNAVVEQAKQEKASDFKPQLQENIDNIQSYDIIFVGTPVWWYTMAPPVMTFLTENNLDNKIIVPFCTHGGGGASSTFTDILKYASNAKILNGFVAYGKGSANTSKEITDWLDKIGITE